MLFVNSDEALVRPGDLGAPQSPPDFEKVVGVAQVGLGELLEAAQPVTDCVGTR